jgi:putative ABC transport system substrate-binding protein
MRRVGVLMNLASDDPEAQPRIGAFLQGLQEFGWVLGRNVRIEYRWGAGADGVHKIAEEFNERVISMARGSARVARALERIEKSSAVGSENPSGGGRINEPLPDENSDILGTGL